MCALACRTCGNSIPLVFVLIERTLHCRFAKNQRIETSGKGVFSQRHLDFDVCRVGVAESRLMLPSPFASQYGLESIFR
jgi:hypothetical protein